MVGEAEAVSRAPRYLAQIHLLAVLIGRGMLSQLHLE